jgi:glycosyltransferase involved in cell wall biosynthesis
MQKILVLNNYPLEWDLKEIEDAKKPNHAAWGINYFRKWGYEVVLIPEVISPQLRKFNQFMNKISPAYLGDIGQQFNIIDKLNSADLIYDASGTQCHLLGYLRALGLLKVPIVCLVHKKLEPSKFNAVRKPFITKFVKGVDAFICLSNSFVSSIHVYGGGEKAVKVDWGPDCNFYNNYLKKSNCEKYRGDIVAIGMTNRDFVTFGLAASQLETPVHIFCRQHSVTEEFKSFRRNVKVTVMANDEFIDGHEFYSVLADCIAIAVPLNERGITHLAGLTSLLDAIGMGKPILMTRNSNIDIDIEAYGMGIWVDHGSVAGWVKAIQSLFVDTKTTVTMSTNAKNLSDDFNSLKFAEKVNEVFEWVLQKH